MKLSYFFSFLIYSFFFSLGKSGMQEKDSSDDEMEQETQRVITNPYS